MTGLGVGRCWKLVALAATVWLSQACSGVAPGAPPVEYQGELRIEDGKLTSTVSGSPVQLKGMSLYWSQWGAAWWNESTVDQAVDYLGVHVIRAPLAVGSKDEKTGLAVDASGGYLSNPDENLARLRTVVDQAIYRGIYVIIDWHDHAAETHTAQAVAFFEQMAREYGNVPNVIFEIYNEPMTTDWAPVKAYAETVIPAIRNTNGVDNQPTRNVIVVGTPFYSQQVIKAASDPITGWDNIAYALHFYAATHTFPNNGMAPWDLDAALSRGIAIFATEWGVSEASGGGSTNPDNADLWLAWLDANKISWCNWELFDKEEGAAMFLPGTPPRGPWTDAALTDGQPYPEGTQGAFYDWTYPKDGTYVKPKLYPPFSEFWVSPSLYTFNCNGGAGTSVLSNPKSLALETSTDAGDWLSFSGTRGGGISVWAAPCGTMTGTRTGYIKFSHGGREVRIKVVQRGLDGNLALGQPTTSSSQESAGYQAANATDGDTNTRWSSDKSDPQWLQVDLGASYALGKVVLVWEAAYSKHYLIELADDPSGAWTTVYDSGTVASDLGPHTDTLTISSSATGRYVRMSSSARATSYGNSLWELQVFKK